jgi:hypothetical protein
MPNVEDYRTYAPNSEEEIREAMKLSNGYPFSMYSGRKVLRFLLKDLFDDDKYQFGLTETNDLISEILIILDKQKVLLQTYEGIHNEATDTG